MHTNISSITILLCFFVILLGCQKNQEEMPDDTTDLDEIYFPSNVGDEWQHVGFEDLGWNIDAEQPLLDLLEEKNTKAFILLKNGRIVIEKYFDGNSMQTNLPWFSAGKTLTAFTVGLAQEKGFLNINNSTSDYLGAEWTSLNPVMENAIKVNNQLTMTSGLDYEVNDLFCTDPECLQYKTDPGAQWYYHNAPYTLLTQVIDNAVPIGFTRFFNSELKDPIGMQGFWLKIGFNEIYFSSARSKARFGLLTLNKGKWKDEIIMSDTNYFRDMITTSQSLNKAYGYLWWLNGKSEIIVPASTVVFQTELIPSAPDDLIAGLGFNDQKLYVVPSEGLVVVRMGDSAQEVLLGPSSFDELLWQKIVQLYK